MNAPTVPPFVCDILVSPVVFLLSIIWLYQIGDKIIIFLIIALFDKFIKTEMKQLPFIYLMSFLVDKDKNRLQKYRRKTICFLISLIYTNVTHPMNKHLLL